MFGLIKLGASQAIVVALLGGAVAIPASAAADFDLLARGPYRAGVPTPETTLGYKLGSRETSYWQQETVLRTIAAAAPDRVRIQQYGESTEGRPLRIVVVSSAENQARLDVIRASLARLADPRGLSDVEAAAIIRDNPVVVWINHNVHGDESTSFESAMQLVYQLAASEEARTLEILRQCVVVINPSYNPDGHERFAVYHNSIGVGDPHNAAIEHDQPWAMHGRFNHYRFDLNRDKLVSSQAETRAEIAEYLRWNPHVYVDQHGETEQYFFPPVAMPINTNADVARQEKWLDTFGRGNAAAFDRYGWDYFTRRIFDLHYTGYLDSWASLNGAIGMTYETDGGGDLGFAWRRDDDTVVTLRDGVAHHFTAALATLDTAAANRQAILGDYVAFRRAAIAEGRTAAMKRVIVVPDGDPGRAAHLVALLRRSGVEVGIAATGFRSKFAHRYGFEKPEARDFAAGAYVIDLAQPQGRLARAFLEQDAALNPEFLKAELAKRERNDKRGRATRKEDAGFYDVTAWSLPLTYGLETWWTEDAVEVSLTPVPEPVEPAGGLRPALSPEGRVIGGSGSSAYVFSYQTDAAARLALALLADGYKLAVSPYELRAGGRNFPRGSLVVRTGRNPQSLAQRIATLAWQTGVEVYAVDSMYADGATTGVGTPDLRSLERPRVLVVAGDSVAHESFGSIWYAFERELHYPFTAVEIDSLGRVDLSKFNVLVLPDGSARAYARQFGKGGVDRLKAWVAGGGTLVAVGGAAAFAADKDVGLTSCRAVGRDTEAPGEGSTSQETETLTTPAAKKKEPVPPAASAEQADSEKAVPAEPLYVPGAIFEATVDHNYFMTYGYDNDHIAVPVNTDLFLTPSKEGANAITFAKDLRRLSGFVWPKNTLQLLRGTAYVVDEPTEAGHVILFADDVTFRRLWPGLNRLFVNAVLFGPSL
jgi:hypothetical protein